MRLEAEVERSLAFHLVW